MKKVELVKYHTGKEACISYWCNTEDPCYNDSVVTKDFAVK